MGRRAYYGEWQARFASPGNGKVRVSRRGRRPAREARAPPRLSRPQRSEAPLGARASVLRIDRWRCSRRQGSRAGKCGWLQAVPSRVRPWCPRAEIARKNQNRKRKRPGPANHPLTVTATIPLQSSGPCWRIGRAAGALTRIQLNLAQRHRPSSEGVVGNFLRASPSWVSGSSLSDCADTRARPPSRSRLYEQLRAVRPR